ncbi:unnamed protein product [Laminaria digitata]
MIFDREGRRQTARRGSIGTDPACITPISPCHRPIVSDPDGRTPRQGRSANGTKEESFLECTPEPISASLARRVRGRSYLLRVAYYQSPRCIKVAMPMPTGSRRRHRDLDTSRGLMVSGAEQLGRPLILRARLSAFSSAVYTGKGRLFGAMCTAGMATSSGSASFWIIGDCRSMAGRKGGQCTRHARPTDVGGGVPGMSFTGRRYGWH